MDNLTTTFKDRNGRTWDLSLNFMTVERVKNQTEIDLLNYEHQHTLACDLAVDDVKLAQTAAAILEPKLIEADIKPEQFADAIADGDILGHIFDAITGAIVNFTRAPRRATVAALFNKASGAVDKAAKVAEKHLESGAVDRRIDSELAEFEGKLSGKPRQS